MSTTNAMILDWAREKGILGRATALDQVLKTIEELGELAGAVSKGDRDAQIDSIGDVYVTLVIINEIMGLGELLECSRYATDETHMPKACVSLLAVIVGRLAEIADDHTNNELFDPESYSVAPAQVIHNALEILGVLSASLGHDLQQCVDHAYGIISKRNGQMRDGVFVKAEEVSSA